MAKSDDVAIVGIGITSFARQPDKTGMDHGVGAVRKAVADAGCTWEDMEFAFGGSAAAGKPDTMVSRLGLTGLPFINVANGVPPVVRAQPNRNPPVITARISLWTNPKLPLTEKQMTRMQTNFRTARRSTTGVVHSIRNRSLRYSG